MLDSFKRLDNKVAIKKSFFLKYIQIEYMKQKKIKKKYLIQIMPKMEFIVSMGFLWKQIKC